MSVPPVVALPRSTRPKPSPDSTPPKMHASSMSFVAVGSGRWSIKRERPNIAISDRSPNRSPSDFSDSRNSGTFNRMLTVPTLISAKWLTS